MFATIAILMLFGVLLVVLETFLPGWVAGIMGASFILVAAGLFLIADEFAGWSLGFRTLMATGVLVLSATILGVWLRWFAGRFFQRIFTLKAVAGEDALPTAPVGQQGVALTELRPLGRAQIGGKSYDVRCQLGRAAAGSRVEVIAAEPGNLLVRLIPS